MTPLQAGNEEQARTELQAALALDPGNKLAISLKRQIDEDPMLLLGKESFAYTVRPNESLSSIAGRHLGDEFLFYALARYNKIAVPRQLAAGQVLRVPGKAPKGEPPAPGGPKVQPPAAPPAPAAAPTPPAPPPAPSPGDMAMKTGEAAERAGDLERALAEYRKAAGLDQPEASGKAGHVARQLSDRYVREARKAFAEQNLDGAIKAWLQVLRVDPGNTTAQLELPKTRALKDKADKLVK